MKNYFAFFIYIYFIASQNLLFSQANTSINDKQIKISSSVSLGEFDETTVSRMAIKDGVPTYLLENYVKEQKRIFQEIKNNPAKEESGQLKPNAPFADCGDMGGENGWGAWKGRKGQIKDSTGVVNWQAWSTPPPANDATYEFTITSGTGVDDCTPSANNPPLPLVSPGFGNGSIQLGKRKLGFGASDRAVEQISFPFTVTNKDTNFVYAYAIILDNPNDGTHIGNAAPHAEIYMLDQKGDTVPCSHQFYIGSSDGSIPPGFYKSMCDVTLLNLIRAYKPWTLVGINLKKFVGQTLEVVITNSDCAFGAHGCWSYWDFRCSTLGSSSGYYCPGSQVSLTAPSDPQIAYTYQWYKNGDLYTGTPSGTAQTITPYPQPGDTFYVDVIQPSKCNFRVVYVPETFPINAAFTSTGACGKVTFTDASTSPTASGTITNWEWSFPGGLPSSSTLQNPGVITYSAIGTYSVTLKVTTTSGCTDTTILPVTIMGLPQAVFSSLPVCEGAPTVFTNNSVPANGDPITSYSWNFPGGNPTSSSVQNPSIIYPAGNYTAELTVTSQAGCISTVLKPVNVNPNPIAAFSSSPVCFNNPTVFANSSSGVGNGTVWEWNFGDGNISSLENPTHTFSTAGIFNVTLIVNNGTCKDSFELPTTINPLPVVNFQSAAVCGGDSTCFKDLSNVTPGNIIGWNWNFGDPASNTSNISNLQNPCHLYVSHLSSTVVLTVTSDSGCKNTSSQATAIVVPPTAVMSPKNGCLNETSLFKDGSHATNGDPINKWEWSFGDGSLSAFMQNPTHTYTTSGTYTVTLLITSTKGCKDTTQGVVKIYNPPVANFSGTNSGCAPVCNTYKDLSTSTDGTISNWQWSFPGGEPSASNDKNPVKVCYYTAGTYGASLMIATSYGCKDTVAISPLVTAYAAPNADFCITPDKALASDPVFTFCDQWSSDVVHWSWNFGDFSDIDTTSTDPVHTYSLTAMNNDFYFYNVCINVKNQHGCWDTICKKVELVPEFTFYIPNTITANGDDKNKNFYGKCRGVKEYNIWVFDRWGNLIWDCHQKGKNTDWDSDQTIPVQEGLSSLCKWEGTVTNAGGDMNGRSGNLAEEDVYVWKVKLLDVFDKTHNYIGHVNIVK